MGCPFDKIPGREKKHLELFLIVQMIRIIYSKEDKDTCSQQDGEKQVHSLDVLVFHIR